MDFSDLVTQDMRLVILKALAEDTDYSLTDGLLQDVLGRFSHRVSIDRLRTELAWLAEQGLLRVELLSDHVRVATMTPRGKDVADGAVVVPGVKRPGPGGW